jgi:hypothetical protein
MVTDHEIIMLVYSTCMLFHFPASDRKQLQFILQALLAQNYIREEAGSNLSRDTDSSGVFTVILSTSS